MTANDGFFREQESPAVLKHGILMRYPDVFAAAAGKTAERVMLLDGYAGRGVYEDGKPGSPMLLLDSAKRTGGFRNVECVFVERNVENFGVLSAVVGEHGAGLNARALHGDLSEHLPAILAEAAGAALFAFLDPFGTALDYDELVGQVLARPTRPPTEVLLHVSVGALRRIAGLLRARIGAFTDADRKTIERVDRFLGGDWWHEIALQASDAEGVATKIAEELIGMYCAHVGKQTGFDWYLFPVRRRPYAAPDYFLVLFTRSRYGLWRFNDSLSKAKCEWQEHWRGRENAVVEGKARRIREAEDAAGVLSLFDDSEVSTPPTLHPPYDEKRMEPRWVEAIEANLAAMFMSGVSFKPQDEILAVYGEVLGDAREKHVAAAIRRLHAAGVTTDTGASKGLSRRLMHPGPNA